MPNALSEDLRWRIIWQCRYQRKKAEQVAVCECENSSADNAFVQTNGKCFPSSSEHGLARKLSELEELTVLNYRFLVNHGVYLDEIQQAVCDKTGTSVSKSTICHEAKKWALTGKKGES